MLGGLLGRGTCRPKLWVCSLLLALGQQLGDQLSKRKRPLFDPAP